MAMKIPKKLSYLSLMLLIWVAMGEEKEDEEVRPYIIHFDPAIMEAGKFYDTKEWHSSVLAQVIRNSDQPGSSRIIYSYKNAISGFSARLSRREISELQNLEGFMGVYPDRLHKLQTSYSYKFLGLSSPRGKLWRKAQFGLGAIIGVLDTGIWPESPSFSDHGMPPVPEKWKGDCQIGADFNQTHCNRKLIGARFYNSGHQANAVFGTRPEYESPRDSQGHGTHTASTAAGRSVFNAGLFGNADGTARGMVPGAHLAMYKVCWDGGCYSSDILAGMDAAIADGVDVISLSIGGFSVPFYEDSVAIGAFRAVSRGVFVTCAAGNSGPYEFSVSNEAPWIMTVGAGTMDRDFPAVVRLADGRTFYGESLFPGMKIRPRFVPLVYAATAGIERNKVGSGSSGNSSFCFAGSLDPEVVKGKFVVCDRGTSARAEKGEVVRQAGGVGMILADSEINGEETAADVHVLPATQVGYAEAGIIKKYISTSTDAFVAVQFRGTVYGRSRAPAVASFSSRGPSSVNPGVLKPDLIAPGVNILAAWPLNLAPSGLAADKRRVMFNVVSGTSMACPHASGIAALIKSVHPDWSPAAIKSALMTTADVVDNRGGPILDNARAQQPADFFATGAGHVNPERAADPGLVYDTGVHDYVRHLCTLGYTQAQVQAITNTNVRCSNLTENYRGLNYPSLSAVFNVSSAGQRWVKLKRTVTNVGVAKSRYSVRVTPPKGVRVIVKPAKLGFTRLNQKKSYSVKFVDTSRRESTLSSFYSFSQGSLTWIHTGSSHNSSVTYTVRSPLTIIWST
ncbi:hypothetical protein SUGI_0478380 [Cryptomeria japonica]|uniref:subtilisin-like protease SBT1.2 n=1 Tax=Cryptomeria japonica TaxID=3369 RepID=UPI00240893AE|nr:subtilisin-like protease SBT1.2 [Cryptomeria japonica]GLJ24984.1 hypothetical protein SUGI_0478380 [Cryptomeria japonica]